MKSYIKTWLLNNMFELSTWIGLVIIIMEIIRYNTSLIMVGLGLVLFLFPDSKLRQFMLKHADKLKKQIERW